MMNAIKVIEGHYQFLSFVQVGYDPITSHFQLLAEIGQDYIEGASVRPADHALSLPTPDYFGRPIEDSRDIVGLLRTIRILPASDGRLYQPDRIVIAEKSQNEMRELFRETPLSVLVDRVWVAESDNALKPREVQLNEAGYSLLRRVDIGLLAVGECVERELACVTAEREQSILANQLRMLAAPFGRVLRTHRDRGYQPRSYACELSCLESIQVRACDHL
jgi:hypothetical protein